MRANAGEVLRYCINGLVATLVHYVVLAIGIDLLQLPSAGLANLIAALFGITCSFLGNRYFVFRGHDGEFFHQAKNFLLLYAFIACLHGLVLFLWTDVGRLDYRLGFIMATCLQVLLSYLGNKMLVFRR